MAEYLATRPMTVDGKRLNTGDRVPMETLRPNLRRQLIDQRKVEADHIDAGPSRGKRKGG